MNHLYKLKYEYKGDINEHIIELLVYIGLYDYEVNRLRIDSDEEKDHYRKLVRDDDRIQDEDKKELLNIIRLMEIDVNYTISG